MELEETWQIKRVTGFIIRYIDPNSGLESQGRTYDVLKPSMRVKRQKGLGPGLSVNLSYVSLRVLLDSFALSRSVITVATVTVCGEDAS